jgi:transcriptional regulator with XRE-family HTH domain
MVLENLGDHIRTLRKARGLSQEALARRADVSLNLVGKLELGMITNPHYTTLAGIARALDVRVEELVEPEASTTGKASALPDAGFVITAEMLEEIEQSWNLPPGQASALLAYFLQTGKLSERDLQEARRELATHG